MPGNCLVGSWLRPSVPDKIEAQRDEYKRETGNNPEIGPRLASVASRQRLGGPCRWVLLLEYLNGFLKLNVLRRAEIL
jgi:hypothetical protein